MSTIKLKIVTPQRLFYEGDVSKVIMRAKSGDMAVLPRHAPMTALVGYGRLRIYEQEDNEPKVAALLGGVALIDEESVIILSDDAAWPEEVDRTRAEQAKDRARERLLSDGDIDKLRAEIALQKALVRIDLANTAEKLKKQ